MPPKLSTEKVRYWSDFNRVFYHPRSIVQINDYELGSSLMPFEKWESGEELFVSLDRDVDLLDRDVRVWAEECDQLQGMQIYTGGDDAWGGFASRYIERLRDEFGKLPIWTWGIEEERSKGQRAQQLLRTLNTARTFSDISTNGSMYIPLVVPVGRLPDYVTLDRDSQWHNSALLSAAVETMTLPSRLRPGSSKRGFLGDLENALNVNGNQRIAQLQYKVFDPDTEVQQHTKSGESKDDRMPSNINRTLVGEDDSEAVNPDLDISLSGCDIGSQSSLNQRRQSDHIFGAVETIRGQAEAVKDEEAEDDETRYMKKRKRFAGLPVIERFVGYWNSPKCILGCS